MSRFMRLLYLIPPPAAEAPPSTDERTVESLRSSRRYQKSCASARRGYTTVRRGHTTDGLARPEGGHRVDDGVERQRVEGAGGEDGAADAAAHVLARRVAPLEDRVRRERGLQPAEALGVDEAVHALHL